MSLWLSALHHTPMCPTDHICNAPSVFFSQARMDRASMPLGVALSQWWLGNEGYTYSLCCVWPDPAFPSRFQPRWLLVNCLCIIHLSLASLTSLSHPLSYQYFLESLPPKKWFSAKISGSGLVSGETFQYSQSITDSGKEAMSTNRGLKNVGNRGRMGVSG